MAGHAVGPSRHHATPAAASPVMAAVARMWAARRSCQFLFSFPAFSGAMGGRPDWPAWPGRRSRVPDSAGPQVAWHYWSR